MINGSVGSGCIRVGKLRKCRACKNMYQVPSPWPGCCSEGCKKKRNSFLLKKHEIKLEPFDEHNKQWMDLRYRVLEKYGRKCMLCGEDRGIIQVDHIKPKSKYPHLAYKFSNLQVLCLYCNAGKSNKYVNDFRPKDLVNEDS